MIIKINSTGFNLYPHSIVKEKNPPDHPVFLPSFPFPPPIPICIPVLQVRELKIHWKDQTLGVMGLNTSEVPSPSLHTTLPDPSTKISLNPRETSLRGPPASASSLALPSQRDVREFRLSTPQTPSAGKILNKSTQPSHNFCPLKHNKNTFVEKGSKNPTSSLLFLVWGPARCSGIADWICCSPQAMRSLSGICDSCS